MTFLGLMLVALGFALMFVAPTSATFRHTGGIKVSIIGSALRAAHPEVEASPALDDLVAAADRALASDPLIKSTGEISQIFDQA